MRFAWQWVRRCALHYPICRCGTFRFVLPPSVACVLTVRSSNSLASFQASRLLAAPLVLAFEVLLGARVAPHRSRAVFIAGCAIFGASAAVAALDDERSIVGASYAAVAVVMSSVYQVFSVRLRLTTRANELQLQLYTKALGAAALVPLAPLVDDYSASSSRSILYFDFDEPVAALLLVSSFLAFLSFAVQRASISMNTPAVYNSLVYTVSALIFAAHFALSVWNPDSSASSARQIAPACAVVVATVLFAHVRDSPPAKSSVLPLTFRARTDADRAFRALARASRDSLITSPPSSSSDGPKSAITTRTCTQLRFNGQRRGSRSDADVAVFGSTPNEQVLRFDDL